MCKERKLLHITKDGKSIIACNGILITQLISQPWNFLPPPLPHPPRSVLELFNHHSTEGKKHENVNLIQKLDIKP